MSQWGRGSTEDPTGVIPGDPQELRTSAGHYSAVADRLEQAGHDMRGQAILNWRGDAATGYDTFREQSAQHYLTAADTARQSAALLTARAQSIDDNRRLAHTALTRRAEATHD